MNPIYYWIAVTKDEYETPIAVAETAAELAQMLGLSRNTVATKVFRDYDCRKVKYRIIKIPKGED